jgi:hypothetical protein
MPKAERCKICGHDGKFREGRSHCAHCGAGKAKALGQAPLGKGGRSGQPPPEKPTTKPPAKPRETDRKGQQGKGEDGKQKPNKKAGDKKAEQAADAATVAAIYKELTALRAENKELRKLKQPAGNSEGPPAARARSAEPGATEDAEVKAKKQRMDELRSQIEHLEKAGDGLEDILAARRAELERLRGEVRAAHPLDVQLRNLDSKLGAVRKQREKLENEAKETAALILELKASLDKSAKAVAEKRAEETQLAVERAELVAKQAAAATPGGDGNPAASDDSIPEPLRGLGLDGMDPALRAGLRAFFATKAAAVSKAPEGAAPPGSQPGTEAATVAAAAEEAAAAAAALLGGEDVNMAEEEEAKKRRRLGTTT